VVDVLPAKNNVLDAANWYGKEPVAPDAKLVAAVADVAEPAVRLEAVPVKPVPGPVNCVVAVMVVPRTVEAVVAPTVVPSIAPPVIATELAACVDIVPKPVMSVLGIVDEAVRAAVPVPLT
jgi:hypothetical protein